MRIFTFFILIFLGACADPTFEKDFYEKASGMKFPENYTIIESFDNGEFLTITTLRFERAELIKFIEANKFDSLGAVSNKSFGGESYLEKEKPNLKKTKDIFIKRGWKGKNDWTYIADVSTGTLWAEITYPDWGGQ